ncbi:acyl-CoA-binding protein [Salinimicrobium sp. GXAS 041]|uniref:acyl-CoA-binding protein n=1 Tax=Salinimicrobium sp. GXAS 041 TaxID=3400806 RepID=UPI003C753AC3
MSSKTRNIEEAFQQAYLKASTTSQNFPPDIMLQFYAYYKQATEESGIYTPSGEADVRSAFKLNALLQVKGMSPNEARLKYIEMVEKYIHS